MAATFKLLDNVTIAFTSATLSTGGSSGRTITFDFSLNRVGLVYYKLVEDIDKVVFEGVYPVFDATRPYSISLSRTCSGDPLLQPAYGFWYWAVDIYGNRSKLKIDPVNTVQG